MKLTDEIDPKISAAVLGALDKVELTILGIAEKTKIPAHEVAKHCGFLKGEGQLKSRVNRSGIGELYSRA